MAEKKKNPIATAGAAMRKAAAGAGLLTDHDYLYAERVRQLFKKNDDIRDSGLTVPDDVARVTGLKYGTDPAQVLDIYYPAGADKALPAIVSVHGGGFVYGDKERYQYYCMSLAQRGFAVVNFSYRLAPEHRFPAQLEDTNLVMRYISGCEPGDTGDCKWGSTSGRKQESASSCEPGSISRRKPESIGSRRPEDVTGLNMIDLNNLFMVGDSAGAMLASQYCAALSNPAYARTLGLDLPPVRIRACALNCGLYAFDPRKDRMMARCYFDGPAEDYTDRMDIGGSITKDFPPAFIMTSTGDFLQARAEPFAAILAREGAEYELHVYGDMKNRPGHVFHCNMKDPLAKRCNDDECAFFLRHTQR